MYPRESLGQADYFIQIDAARIVPVCMHRRDGTRRGGDNRARSRVYCGRVGVVGVEELEGEGEAMDVVEPTLMMGAVVYEVASWDLALEMLKKVKVIA